MSVANSIGYVLLAYALAIGGGSMGTLLARSHRRLCALISLGAGTLLGVTMFAILPETFHDLRWWQALVSAGTGYGVFSLVTKYVYHVCPACAASHFDEAATQHFREIAAGMMIALAIHCFADGAAMAAGREADAAHAGQGRSLDIAVVVAVCVHKVPEGLALGALLLGAGLTPMRSIALVAAVESTTVLGGLAGLFFLRGISDFWLGAVLAHAGGGFVFLAAHAVLGEVSKHDKTLVLANFIFGISLIGVLVLFLRFM